jgi:hypothetical protein
VRFKRRLFEAFALVTDAVRPGRFGSSHACPVLSSAAYAKRLTKVSEERRQVPEPAGPAQSRAHANAVRS